MKRLLRIDFLSWSVDYHRRAQRTRVVGVTRARNSAKQRNLFDPYFFFALPPQHGPLLTIVD